MDTRGACPVCDLVHWVYQFYAVEAKELWDAVDDYLRVMC